MLEPTEEMIAEAMEAHNASGAYGPAVAAVLAIVERDNLVHPLCAATLGTGMRCEYAAGMAHPNEHSAKAPSGSRVRWS